jgi:hypothetical protein
VATAVTGVVDLAEWWQRRNAHANWLEASQLDYADGPSEWMPPPKVGTSWSIAGVAGPLVALVVALAVVITPFVLPLSTVESIGVTPGPNQVTNWSSFNYSGYEAQAAYPEYEAVIRTMEKVGRKYGCGQAMWQYDPSLNRFGTTMALMLLPYWSNGCIGSMEGLLFESSATTPYHFLNQAELSEQPSEPMVGLDYSALNVPQGIQHLQLLGVRYFMASSPTVEAAADADPSLRMVASTGPWVSTSAGTTTTTTWKIYKVLDAPEVTPLANDPAVEVGIKPGQSTWLPPSEAWYNDPARWNVELAQSGPASWPRVPIGDAAPPQHHTAPTRVSKVHETDNAITFHVTKVGTPVLVKVSYFPNWKAAGATGPYRVTPNLMVVVPTSHNVTLTYGATAANRIGQLLSFLGIVGLLAGVVLPRLLSRRRAARTSDLASTP